MKILLKYHQIRLKNICNRIIVHKKSLFRDEKRAYTVLLLLLLPLLLLLILLLLLLLLVILNSFQDPAPSLLLYSY